MESGEECLKNKTILLVEDEELMRDITSRWVRKIAKEVFTASNGEEGIESYKANKPNIVITDLEMPKMNGIKMIDKLKELDPNLPIIVITAFSDESHRAPKADAVITKPIIKADLMKLLLKLCG